MSGRNWNTLIKYTCGLLHPSNGPVTRRTSFFSHSDLPHARVAMGAPNSVALVSSVSPSQLTLQTFSTLESPHSFAAASFTGSANALKRNVLTAKTSRFSNAPFRLGVYLQTVWITNTSFQERMVEPLYRRKRKKVRGRGGQVAKQPGGEVVQSKAAVVVVESPAKARTIEKYLGAKYVVLPSFGHVRDLAAKAGSVRPEEDFDLVWEVPASARQHLNSIKAAVKGADCLVLASDPDREGEAIAWHVLEMLKMEGAVEGNLKVRRVVFNEITKTAVLKAMEVPRDISRTLVDAYLARRALDYLIGFDLSPVLWRKLPGSRSAGRVQSAALRLVCQREFEMETFVSQEYWTINAEVAVSNANSHVQGKPFPARVTHVDGEKLSQFSLSSEAQARAVAQRVEMSQFSVCSVKKSVVRRNPLAPYITSTLQQDASSKLAFGASRTMALAQQLYEGIKLDNDELTGLITYMRTDGVQLSGEAVQSIRSMITERYGGEYLPKQPRQFTSRAKNAQEAHEAIRPTDISRLPSMLTNVLEEDALRLYSLIWCRTVASQMEQASFAQVTVDIMNDTEDLQLRVTDSLLSFPGFLAAFKDAAAVTSSKECNVDEGEVLQHGGEDLRGLEAGDLLSLNGVQPIQHFTEPPPRYSEGTLVKKLEELGIGRPSTYASTLKTLQARNYMKIEKRRIIPEGRGRMVSAFLEHYFPRFSDYEFTAKLEAQLDEVSAGRAEWKNILQDFWPQFHAGVTAALKIPFEEVVGLLEGVFAEQFFSSSVEKTCPSCHEGKMGLKLSRFGSGYFLGCSLYPKCMYKTNVLSVGGDTSSDDEEEIGTAARYGVSPSKTLGIDPASGLEVKMKVGPYGKYLQIDSGSKKQKPKRVAIPKDMNPNQIELPEALELLKYPYELGKHPESGAPMVVGVGQYGIYLRCKGSFVSIPNDSINTLTIEQGVALLQSKNASRSGRKQKSAKASADEGTDSSESKTSKTSGVKVKGGSTNSSAKKSSKSSAYSTEKVKGKSSAAKKTSKAGGEKAAKDNIQGEVQPKKTKGNILAQDGQPKTVKESNQVAEVQSKKAKEHVPVGEAQPKNVKENILVGELQPAKKALGRSRRASSDIEIAPLVEVESR